MQAAVALTRLKGTRPRTIAVIPRQLARTRRPPVLIPHPAAPTLLLAAATAAAVPLTLAVAEVPLTLAVAEAPPTAAVVERLMAVAAVLTAIVKINKITAFRKWPALSNEAGHLLFPSWAPANPKRGSATLCAHAG
jgi:hypothetical protein